MTLLLVVYKKKSLFYPLFSINLYKQLLEIVIFFLVQISILLVDEYDKETRTNDICANRKRANENFIPLKINL